MWLPLQYLRSHYYSHAIKDYFLHCTHNNTDGNLYHIYQWN